MNIITINGITALLQADGTVEQQRAAEILNVCRASNIKRELISAKEACAILSISKVTLRQYVRRGLLNKSPTPPERNAMTPPMCVNWRTSEQRTRKSDYYLHDNIFHIYANKVFGWQYGRILSWLRQNGNHAMTENE